MRHIVIKLSTGQQIRANQSFALEDHGTRKFRFKVPHIDHLRVDAQLQADGQIEPIDALAARREGDDLVVEVTRGTDKAEVTLADYFTAKPAADCDFLYINNTAMDYQASTSTLVERTAQDASCLVPFDQPLRAMPAAEADHAVSPAFALLGLLFAGGGGGGSSAAPVVPALPVPDAPVLLASSDSGASQADRITNADHPVLRVTLPAGVVAGQAIELLDGDRVLGHAVLGADDLARGYVDIQSALLADGTHAVQAHVVDAAGHAGASGAATSVLIDTVPPAPPPLDLTAASDSGRSSSDHITYVNTPTLRVSLAGTGAVAGDVMQLRGDGAPLLAGIAIGDADVARGWIDVTLPLQADGVHRYSASITDVAGNTGLFGADLAVTIDTLAPDAPNVPMLMNANGPDNTSTTATPTLRVALGASGAVAGDLVQLLDAGGAVTQAALTAADVAAGYVDLVSPFMSNGDNHIRARVIDVAGNIGPASGELPLTIDVDAGPKPPPPPVPDTTPPTVASVAITSTATHNHAYWPTEVIQVTVSFDEAIVLAGGTPDIQIDVGGVPHVATYTGTSGSNGLVFSYTVQPGDSDTNGIAVTANGMDLHGATLQDLAGNTAVLNYSGLPDAPAHLVSAHFTNVSTAAGITENSNGAGLTFGDANGDGYVDLATAPGNVPNSHGGVNSLIYFANNGNGTFTESEVASGIGVATSQYTDARFADIDGDGDLDLYAVDWNGGPDALYRNDGTGHFTSIDPVTQGLSPWGGAWAIGWADIDGDGDLDLLETTSFDGAHLFLNDGSGHFTAVSAATSGFDDTAAFGPAAGPKWADYDKDGFVDVFVPMDFGTQDALFHNDGHGHFTRVDTSVGIVDSSDGQSSIWVDYDNDGWLDLFVVNAFQEPTLYHNDHNGHFTAKTASQTGISNFGQFTAGVAWADVDGDGDMDVYMSSQDNGTTKQDLYYRNNGDGTFTRSDPPEGFFDSVENVGAGWTDYNGDGLLDLYTTGEGQDALYRNNGAPLPFLDVQLKNSRGITLEGLSVEVFDAVTHARIGTQLQNSGGSDGNDNVRFYGVQDGHAYDFRITYNDHGVTTVVTNGNAAYDVAGAVMQTNDAYGGVVVGSGAGQVNSAVLTAEAETSTDGSSLLLGTRYNDNIVGDAGDDLIRGNGGNDLIDLSAGGNDTLDYLFIDAAAPNGHNGTDTVKGFSTAAPGAGGDRIDLDKLLTAHTAGAVTGTASSASESNGFLRLDLAGGTATLQVDRDGGGDSYSPLLVFTTADPNAQLLLQQMLAQNNIVL